MPKEKAKKAYCLRIFLAKFDEVSMTILFYFVKSVT